jgi:fused signal recognition particle receptor
MAPFNWFNRKHSEDKTPSETASEAIASSSEETSKAQTEAAETSAEAPAEAPAVAQDQLAWAKAAYENIRKRKQEEQQSQVVSSESTEPAATVTEPAVESAVEPVAEATSKAIPALAAPEIEPEIESDQAIAEPVAASAPPQVEVEPSIAAVFVSSAEVAPTEPPIESPIESPIEPPIEPAAAAIESTPAPTAESSPPSPLPFWAQAEAERLERLERLRLEAESTELKEQEAAPTTTQTAVDEASTIPDFVLDEAFLWSAEVLAAQGRRPDDISIEEITWLKRLRQGLDKTRRTLVNQLRSIVGQGPLNQDAVVEIESLLLQADVGVEATDYIIESLQNRLREESLPPAEAIAYLKGLLREMLDRPLGGSHSLTFVPEKDRLNIWLITGVNGAGKTTTIGKLAHIANKSGYRCLIAAADTFRAAAVQQVKVWGERSQVDVIANPGKNTDPAAVVFDGITAAQSRGTELLLVDTAGRLQNKKNLMDELSKIRRIIDKKAPDAKIESLLVLDATLGQNGLRQAEVFSEVAKLSGVVLTKLDGTAKGGIALAVVQQLGLPIRFIGAGEGIEDLRPFSSYEFVEALLSG